MPLLDFLTGGGRADGDLFGGLFTRLRDRSGGNISKVDREILLPAQEYLPIGGRNNAQFVPLRVDRNGNVLTGNYIPELLEPFEGSIVNFNKWTQSSTTFVPGQTTLAGYNFNTTSLNTLSAVSILISQRVFYKFVKSPLQHKSRKRHLLVSGSIVDFGFGIPTATTLIVPNGVCFRITTSGIVQGFITYNGIEIAQSDIFSRTAANGNVVGAGLNMSNSAYTSNYFIYDLIVDDDGVIFTVLDTSTGEIIGYAKIFVPSAYQKMWGATGLPVYERVFNNTAPTVAPIFLLTELSISSTDMNIQFDASAIAGHLGLSGGRHPFTGAPMTTRLNSTVPATVTLSNSVTSYAQPDIGFAFAAVAGAETDYLITSFAVPVGSRFLCEGVVITMYNLGAAVATTPTIFEWAMGFNSIAAALATGNSIRRQVGVQAFVVGAVIGQTAQTIDATFTTPEVTESGRFVQVAMRIPVSTATINETFRGTINIKGRYI